MSGRACRAVLFDLDGTLADTAPDLIAAVNRLRAEAGRAALPEAALRPLVSKGGRALLARVAGVQRAHGQRIRANRHEIPADVGRYGHE